MGCDEKVLRGVHQQRGDQFIALAQTDRDQPGGPAGVVRSQGGLLDQPVLRDQHEVRCLAVVADVEHLGDLLAWGQSKQVRDVLPLRIPSGLDHLVRLRAVDAPRVGEEQQPVVGCRHEEVLDHVIGAQLSTLDSLASAVLTAVVVDARALDVPASRDRDDHVLFWDQVLDGHIPVIPENDLRAAIIPPLVSDLGQLVDDDLTLPLRLCQDVLVVAYLRLELIVLVVNLLTLQGGESAKLHGQNRVRLELVNIEQPHQAGLGLIRCGGLPDQSDDGIQRVQSLEIAAQNVGAGFCFLQPELRASHDHVHLVARPIGDELIEA